MSNIRNITIITAQGVKVYQVGERLNDFIIERIAVEPLNFTGDPYDHYVGRSYSGDILFTVNCLSPCAVEYFINQDDDQRL